MTTERKTELLCRLDTLKNYLREIYEHCDCHGTDHTDARHIRDTQAEIAEVRRQLK
jgi:hypothetical protein